MSHAPYKSGLQAKLKRLMFHKTILEKILAQNSAPWISRFAPSPSGYLHLGHILSCSYVFGLGRALNAKILLRIEDHDRIRSRSEYEAAIIEDLAWLGFEFDNQIQCDNPSLYRQSNCEKTYQAIFEQLKSQNKIYVCNCSRRDIEARLPKIRNEDLRYDAFCRDRNLELETGKSCLRLMTTDENIYFEDLFLGQVKQNLRDLGGDFVIKDRDNNWTYVFCNTIDDINQKINLVIRGLDIESATGRQIYLRQLLGANEPLFYAHHPLIKNENGEKLSKRSGSTAISSYRNAGFDAKSLLTQSLEILGIPGIEVQQESKPLETLINHFRDQLIL